MMTSALVRGGAQRRMAATAAGLIRQGARVRLIGSRPARPGDIDFLPDIHAMGIDAQIAPQGPLTPATMLSLELEAELRAQEIALPVWWLIDLARPFARAILDCWPTVVHGWVDRFAIMAGLVACTLGVPRIIIGLTSTTPEKRGFDDAELLRSGYQALATNKNVAFVSVSQQCASEHEEWLGFRKGCIKTIYAGLLPGLVRIPRQDEIRAYRETLGIASDAPVVGTIMRFDEVKDPGLWIETAKEIASVRPDVRFLLAGSGVHEESMKQQIAASGLRSRVVMPGAALDIGLSYAAMDIFLMTSRAEGLGNTLIEAQAARRPVVSVDVGGAREAMLNGITGTVVESRSAQSLARAVLTALEDTDWGQRAANEAAKFVAAHFGYDRMISETLQVYAHQGWPGVQPAFEIAEETVSKSRYGY
jgi:glycosyltransferase involved in cell wall biosynthesis